MRQEGGFFCVEVVERNCKIRYPALAFFCIWLVGWSVIVFTLFSFFPSGMRCYYMVCRMGSGNRPFVTRLFVWLN